MPQVGGRATLHRGKPDFDRGRKRQVAACAREKPGGHFGKVIPTNELGEALEPTAIRAKPLRG